MNIDLIERPPVIIPDSDSFPEKYVFVFGSNVRGIHGGGAARIAHQKYGAIWGKGIGHWGRSYAIPTKGNVIYLPTRPHEDPRVGVGETLTLPEIEEFVKDFIKYAERHPDITFKVTCIGCGLAGLQHADIAPMFCEAPDNCWFDELWLEWLPDARMWGTF